MSPQQLLDRINSDCSLLAKLFLDEQRFMGAEAIVRAIALLRTEAGKRMSVETQVVEMSEADYQPRVGAERGAI